MDRDRLKAVLEALLVASPEPLTVARAREALGEEAPEPAAVRAALEELAAEYDSAGRGFELREVAGGFQLYTRREHAEWVRRLLARDRAERLSRAALETLAVIAYKQPIPRAEIERIRGVNVDGVLKTLLERGLIRVMGRMDAVGRPLLYGTTDEFLRHFGLRNLSELPKIEEFAVAREEAGGGVDLGFAGDPANGPDGPGLPGEIASRGGEEEVCDGPGEPAQED